MNLRFTEGEELPELVKQPTTRQLVQYAGASGDFYEIHYDHDFARSTGLPGVILHGLLKAGFMAQLVTSTVGRSGRLKRHSRRTVGSEVGTRRHSPRHSGCEQ